MAEEDVFVLPLRMEEEEEAPEQYTRRPMGFLALQEQPAAEGERPERRDRLHELIEEILKERQAILSDAKLRTRDKLRLLEANHRTLLVLRGGRFRTFQTEAVVFAILAFSAVVLVTLAVLNVKANLAPEITLTFLGTTLGGTIATIAQKLGRI